MERVRGWLGSQVRGGSWAGVLGARWRAVRILCLSCAADRPASLPVAQPADAQPELSGFGSKWATRTGELKGLRIGGLEDWRQAERWPPGGKQRSLWLLWEELDASRKWLLGGALQVAGGADDAHTTETDTGTAAWQWR